MKKLILTSVCTFAIFTAVAGSNYLHVRTSSGWEVLDLDKVDRLSFSGETMVASDASGNTVSTYPRTELQTMQVDNDFSGVNLVIADESEAATFSFDASSDTVVMMTDGDFEIFNPTGVILLSIPGVKKGETIALAELQSGVLILKSGNYSIKVIIK